MPVAARSRSSSASSSSSSAGVLAAGGGLVAELLELGALLQQPGLPVVGLGGRGDGFVLEMPAVPALLSAQRLAPFGAGRAHRLQRWTRRARSPARTWPVSRLVRRSWTGRMHPPRASASIRIASRGAGPGHPLGPGGSLGHAASPSIPACQVVDQPHSGQSCLMVTSPSSVAVSPVPQTGHGSSVRHRWSAGSCGHLLSHRARRRRSAMARMSASETQAARTRTGSGSDSSRTNATPAPISRVGRDQLGGGASVAGSVAEDHVDLLGLVQPHGDPVGEQVADGHDFLARVLQRGDHAVPDGAALGGEGGQVGLDPLPQCLSGW